MKKLTLALLPIIIFLISSCDILNQKPQGSLSLKNFYKTKKDAIAAVNAIYSSMYTQQVWLWRNADAMPSDDIAVPTYTPFDRLQALSEYTFDAENSEMNGIWSTLYGTVNKANLVILRVPDIQMDKEVKNRILGQAYFLRAFVYYELTATYGRVPIILSDNMDDLKINVPASPQDSVFKFIISDLKKAEKSLPESYNTANVGRPTNYAATAMLARVYLWTKNWAGVEKSAKKVIDSGNYGLFDDYANAFKSLDHENGKGHIWEYQMSPLHQQYWAEDLEVPRGSDFFPGGGSAEIVPEIELFNTYDPDDYRRQVNFVTWYSNAPGDTVRYQDFEAGVPLIGKYFNKSYNVTQLNSLNRPIIRYADVLLMYAEALNELDRTGEAYKYINMVRKRARNGDPNAAPQDYKRGSMTQSEFRQAVYHERRLEFAFEGIRKHDLIRTGRLIEAMKRLGIEGGNNIKPYNVRYPIPQIQLDLNPALTQNPGYN